jgi:hypothetical protein
MEKDYHQKKPALFEGSIRVVETMLNTLQDILS